MGDWSDWYLKEDTTKWVLPQILKARAEEHPDRDFLKFGTGKWISYGEVYKTLDAGRKRTHQARCQAGRVRLGDASELRGVPADLVRHPLHRCSDEPDQHRLQG